MAEFVVSSSIVAVVPHLEVVAVTTEKLKLFVTEAV